MQRWILWAALMLAPPSLQADNYKIVRLAGTTSIKIGTRLLHQEDTFDDHEVIHWADSNQAIKAVALDGPHKGHSVVLSARACRRSNANTLYRYANMAGRSAGGRQQPAIVFPGEDFIIEHHPNEGCSYIIQTDSEDIQLTPQGNFLWVNEAIFPQSGLYEGWLVCICSDDKEPLMEISVDVVKEDI